MLECCVQSCSPAQAMTTPASEVSQGSPQRRLHTPAMPFLDVSSPCPPHESRKITHHPLHVLCMISIGVMQPSAQQRSCVRTLEVHVKRHIPTSDMAWSTINARALAVTMRDAHAHRQELELKHACQ